MGRKGRYETFVKPYLSDIKKWIETLTESQIAGKLGVSVPTFEKYKREHDELRDSLSKGKAALVEELKDTLKKKARGFYYKETKKTVRDINGVRTQVIEEYEKYSAPDTGAIHLLLKNLDDTWRNDDRETMDIKREKLELDKQKMENEW
jgi:ppGpp synthetase/RelA/SpoT-type nucleotidyltranferase